MHVNLSERARGIGGGGVVSGIQESTLGCGAANKYWMLKNI